MVVKSEREPDGVPAEIAREGEALPVVCGAQVHCSDRVAAHTSSRLQSGADDDTKERLQGYLCGGVSCRAVASACETSTHTLKARHEHAWQHAPLCSLA